MKHEEMAKALMGKEMEYTITHTFTVEEVEFHHDFLLMLGKNFRMPLNHKHVEQLIRDSKVVVSKQGRKIITRLTEALDEKALRVDVIDDKEGKV